MIALDTNALVRLIIDDHKKQARSVRNTVQSAESNSVPILILNEVLLETVWVLEAVYRCERREIHLFLERLMETSVFTFTDPDLIREIAKTYKSGGDFADIFIVKQAQKNKATCLLSFDQKLQKQLPDFVIKEIHESELS